MPIDLISLPKGWPLNVISLVENNDDVIIKPHRHEYFEVLWSLGNTGKHSIDFLEYELKASRLYLITPNQVHDSSQLGNHVRLLTFHPGFIQSYRHKLVIEEVFFPRLVCQPFVDIDQTGEKELGAFFVRNDTNPKLAMYAMSIGAICNLVLDYLFIIEFGWGMTGAAVATGIAQVTIGCILLMV